MAKRGRPVKVCEPDPWAAVRLAKRIALVKGGDPALAEYPLGILLARGIIDADQHKAGCEYGKTYAMAIGRKRDLGFDTAGQDDIADETLARIEKQHGTCQRALKRLGGHVLRITEEVCVYRIMRPWLLPDGKTTAGNDDRTRLELGLDTLVRLVSARRPS